MKLLVIFLFTIFVILLTIVIHKYYNTDYFTFDYVFDSRILVPGDIESKVNIGVGTEPEEDAFLSVNGDLVVKDKFCIGDTCFTYEDIKKLNKLPLYTKDSYCLYDKQGNKECISEDHLKMLTGEKNMIFVDRNNQTLQPYQVSHHGRDRCTPFGAGHDDNGADDGSLYGGFEIYGKPWPDCPPGRGNADCQGYYGCMPGNAAAHAVCAHPSNGSAGGDCPALDRGHTSLYCPGGKFWRCADEPIGYNLYHDKGKTHLETLKKEPYSNNNPNQEFRLMSFPEQGETTIDYKCYE